MFCKPVSLIVIHNRYVTLTVKLTVEVKDGYDEMNAEELEGVLQDMDYRFTPSDEHQASGISFNEMETEITDWEY